MNPLLRSKRLACGVAAAAIFSATVANAADPANGTIGSSAPKVSWGGTLTSSGIFYNAWANDPTIECSAPACDTFTLTIADGPHPVTIKYNILSTNADGSDPGAGIRIKFPDGSYQYTQGNASETTAMAVKLKNAVAGEYVIDTVTSHACCGPEDYTASAEITGAAAPSPGPTTGGGGTTTPPPTGGPTPPTASPQLTVKAGKASAKKLSKSKRLTLTATSTGNLNNVSAKFLKGKKTVGSAKLVRLNGTAKMILKLKGKIKKGTYTATVSGTDDQGRVVTTGIKVKVKK